MPESLEIQIARMQEQLKSVITTLAEDREDRRMRDKQISKIVDTTERLDHRLAIVEKQLAENDPTIQEFLKIKHQVHGAGLAGKWLWAVGGVLIGWAFAAKTALQSLWFN